MNILIVDRFEQPAIDALKHLGARVVYDPAAGADGLPDALKQAAAEILIVRSTKVQASILHAAKDLRVIIRAGAGIDNIDIAAATAAGIRVCNCPGMNAVAVAELAMGLLLSCDRRIPDQTADIKLGHWSKKKYATGARGLKGSTLGVIGLGAIGDAVVRRAQAFEMNVVGWSRSLSPASAQRLGIKSGGNSRPSLLAMLPTCDAVSIHLALNPETRRFCDGEFFAAMKPGATFINTSRGGVVDESALQQAVASKGLRCGLDVFESQPAGSEGPFLTPLAQLAGCALTHHTGASTDQAQTAVAEEVVRLVKCYAATGAVENCVNPPDSQVVGAATRPLVDVKTGGASAGSGASPKVSR